MVSFKKVDYPQIASMRTAYLRSLNSSEELYLELIVKNSDYYLIIQDDPVGYFIVSPDNILVQFYLRDESIPQCESIFDQILAAFPISSAYCKSFDSLLLKCCLGRAKSHRITGTLFRDLLPSDRFPNTDCTVRTADSNDYNELFAHKSGLYESAEELEMMLRGGNIRLFHRDQTLIGCGFLFKVTNQADNYDIGMWVNPDFRRQGYATMIISELKENCLAQGWTPVCGCASENVASRKTLEKNGFISKYDLIEFSLLRGGPDDALISDSPW